MSKSTRPGGRATRSPHGFIVWRLVWTWLQTLAGIALMGGLVTAALLYFGLQLTWGALFLSLWIIIPLLGWYFSGHLVKRLTGCRAPNPHNPEHQRLVRIVDKLFPKTGLAVKPPVYVSPIKLPNAFATGRTPGHAFIAATEGLLQVGLTDDELEAVIAHELAHVRNYDVALNSMLAALGSLFSIILASGLPRIFNPAFISTSRAPLLDDLSEKVRNHKKRFFLPDGGVIGFITMLILFYIVSTLTKFISLFVARVRESAADAHACYWTGNPCALSMALQKILLHVKKHAADIRHGIITRGLAPLLFVSPLEDDELDLEAAGGMVGGLRRWWRGLGENHPPIRQRLDVLDKMSGRACPRVI